MLEADELIWQQFNKRARGGIRRRGTVDTPLDALMPTVMNSLEVQMALMPRQGYAAPPKQQPTQPASDDSAKLIAALQNPKSGETGGGTGRSPQGRFEQRQQGPQ